MSAQFWLNLQNGYDLEKLAVVMGAIRTTASRPCNTSLPN